VMWSLIWSPRKSATSTTSSGSVSFGPSSSCLSLTLVAASWLAKLHHNVSFVLFTSKGRERKEDGKEGNDEDGREGRAGRGGPYYYVREKDRTEGDRRDEKGRKGEGRDLADHCQTASMLL